MAAWEATFEPMWTVSLLPQNATPWERALDDLDADLVARNPVQLIPVARRPFECPPTWLAHLAMERSVDEYDSAWAENRRRAVIAGSFDLHRTKGTRPALVRSLAPLGFNVTVREWFEAARPPYTFSLKVQLGMEPWLGRDRDTLVRVANAAKNAHTKLESIEPERRISGGHYCAGVPTRRRTLRVGQIPRADEIRMPGYSFTGAALMIRRTLRVGPRPS